MGEHARDRVVDHNEIIHGGAEGDRVAARVIRRGTHRGTHPRVLARQETATASAEGGRSQQPSTNVTVSSSSARPVRT